ncbi:tyrosine-protein phosphatase [Lactobacillus amylovorus]|uniref:Tyrosine-protein phosphatase n=1 Tax=Lactobacillus amylovorus TaxID=1604 RepID=A0A9X3W758_LACAM|nr:tyrosine-protein phosphatase [Lactobacillus amylovorus]MDB6234655.1 tyrosine-protein phosphatase [Lactobacillus amylovorus]MDB6243352.1 tyrosine-protein phosphatase [Lactobacillus amylovorus]MDB6245134.1 tyrosine-protein phosphatase [Lactobacillus amylovorus]MDB6248996.1 tyrosine-protein phosphatase [Lactobacillus amylovorus]MDB6254266.1 tyrosine-protein phosphatase [Lactobacillus amylovorus]
MTKKLTNQLIGVTSGRNFRELGGYETMSGKKIKMHKLLRTGNLADLSPFDKQFLTDYGVKYDVDFRSKQEVDNQPDRVPDGVEYIYDPVFSEDLTNSSKSLNDLNKQAHDDADFGFNHMHYAYEDMIESESAQNAYRKFFDVLLKNTVNGESVIFHCTAGKDRTGFGALLALSALGVPFSTIKKDYLLTNITTKDFIDSMIEHARQNGRNENVLQSIRDIQSVRAEYLDHAVKVLNDEYGSINDYLRDVMKLSSADIMELRDIYLED